MVGSIKIVILSHFANNWQILITFGNFWKVVVNNWKTIGSCAFWGITYNWSLFPLCSFSFFFRAQRLKITSHGLSSRVTAAKNIRAEKQQGWMKSLLVLKHDNASLGENVIEPANCASARHFAKMTLNTQEFYAWYQNLYILDVACQNWTCHWKFDDENAFSLYPNEAFISYIFHRFYFSSFSKKIVENAMSRLNDHI